MPASITTHYVRYIPKYLQDEEACNTPEGVEELNEVNEKICDYLSCSWGELITIRPLAQFSVISVPLVSYGVFIQIVSHRQVNSSFKMTVTFDYKKNYSHFQASVYL